MAKGKFERTKPHVNDDVDGGDHDGAVIEVWW